MCRLLLGPRSAYRHRPSPPLCTCWGKTQRQRGSTRWARAHCGTKQWFMGRYGYLGPLKALWIFHAKDIAKGCPNRRERTFSPSLVPPPFCPISRSVPRAKKKAVPGLFNESRLNLFIWLLHLPLRSQSKILLECINLVTNHPFLHRLWVQFHRSASNLHWSMISDQECHTFCTETLGYAANLRSACTIHQSWWEPNEPWWHTWQHLIQPDAVWGVSASSVGASLGAFGGPTSKYELSHGALPLHEVVSSARRIVYLAQPGVTTDEFSSLLTSSQHVEVIILGVPQCDEHWMTFAAQLTQTGIAFCAYEEKLSQSQPYGSSTRSRHSLRSFRAPCVSWFFITRDTLHSTRQPNGFVFCAPPFDMHLYIIVERFIEHLNGGIRAAFHLRRGEPEFLDGLELYAAMARHGIENFLILPLQVSTPERLPSVERRWIKFFGKHVCNTRDVTRPCHLRWRFFKRIPASSEVLHRQRVKTNVGQLLSNHRRVNMSVPALLDLMCESQSMVTRAHWIELWRIVKLKIHQRTGVHIYT